MRRAGKPWAAGSGSRFMPTAIIGSRPGAIAQAVGKPTVKPSTERPTIWVAPGDAGRLEHVLEADAGPQRVADEVVADRLLTQAIVTYCSKSGIARSSS